MSSWYQKPIDEVVAELGSDPDKGLTEDEARQRLDQYGSNELVERGEKSAWMILFDQFKETMVVILIIAAAISGFLGEITDAIAVLVVVVLNALLGFRQEYQAERAMAALKKLAVPTVRVRRGGHVKEISASLLVPGDIVLLEAGNLVPADLRLIESVNLRTQEAALTGESEPVNKQVDPIAGQNLPLADRRNLAYMGTVVGYGRGRGIVVATGMKTELGGIAELMQTAGNEPTPLQRRLDQLGKGLALAAFVLVGIVFGLGLVRGEEVRTLLLTSIGIAVAAVPEGLPAVVTIALALGAKRMLKRKALIRKLPAVETLGSVTVICSDKTGTLTENRMTVTMIDLAENRIDLTEDEHILRFAGTTSPCESSAPTEEQAALLHEHPALTLLLAGGALANDALLECNEADLQHYAVVGDPTEGALLVAAERLGLDKTELEKIFPRVAEVPFDSERKRMTTVHQMPADGSEPPPGFETVLNWSRQVGGSNLIIFTKGAVDGLTEISDRVWVDDRIEPINAEWKERILRANENLARQGMRVLGVASRSLDDLPKAVDGAGEASYENGLVFIGLVGMIDPARAEVKDAVQTCREAGIRPMMITGDHPLTARYIADQLGIPVNGKILTGQDLEQMSPQDLDQTVATSSVFARVSPEHKLKIVGALQNRGHIAAMTGDGVNDAPALKKADIGVAMGITGTDVSKEASDMVLLDDNFATIVAAVEEGRVIYDNIRKFIKYTLTSNAGEIWIMLLAPFLGMPLALLPLQILWINLVTDGLPGLALGVEIPERNTMRRPPYPPKENIFARGVGRDVLWIGFLMGVMALGAGYFYWRAGNPAWQTMVFTTITLSEMGYVMAIRSSRDSLFTIGIFSNRSLILTVILTTILQISVLFVPFLRNLLQTVPLTVVDILICLALSLALFTVVEIQKWVIRRKDRQDGVPAVA